MISLPKNISREAIIKSVLDGDSYHIMSFEISLFSFFSWKLNFTRIGHKVNMGLIEVLYLVK